MLVEGRGVPGGWSAARLLGASRGPRDAPAEVVVPGGRRAGRTGLVVRSDLLPPDEILTVDGVGVTCPLRTASDLACRTSLLDAVIAVDAVAHRCEFEPVELLVLARRRPGARGSGRLPEVVRRSDRPSDSPTDTRIRMAIQDAGLVVPVLQHPVGPDALDMAYPGIRLGIEYDGREHLTQERAVRDLARPAFITRAGWDVLRFRAVDVLRRPRWVPIEVDLLEVAPRSSWSSCRGRSGRRRTDLCRTFVLPPGTRWRGRAVVCWYVHMSPAPVLGEIWGGRRANCFDQWCCPS